MTCKLEGKVAIITGAASGIGEAAARLFVAHGAMVVIADIQDQLGLTVAASLGPDKCSYKHCDVSDEEQVEAVIDYTISTFGRLDIVYSNAGIGDPTKSILEIKKNELDKVLSVNVTGSALMMKHGARAMISRGVRGSIVCTASVCGRQACHGPAAYTTSKHALLGLVRAAAGELGEHGIRVNSISPYAVATPLMCSATGGPPELVEQLCRYVCNVKGVALKASHVAEAALYLASDEAAFVSGHDLVLDSGITTFSAMTRFMPKQA